MDKKLEIKDYLNIALRRKWFFIIPFIVIIMVTAGYAKWAPKIYRAFTLILVQQPELPRTYVQPTIIERREGRLQTIEQQIKSRSFIEVIADEFKFHAEGKSQKTPPSRESVIQSLRRRITIEVTGDQIFSISYEDRNPVMAMKIANRLTTLFIERSLQQREERVLSTISFLDRELERVKKLMKQQERELSEFRTSHFGMLAEYNRLGTPSPPADIMESDDLVTLYSLLRRLRLKYTDEHPEIIKLKAKIAEAEKKKSNVETDKSEAQLSQADAETTQLQAEKKRLLMEQQLKELIRKYEVTQGEYQSLFDKKLQAELAANMERGQKGQRFLILEQATIPQSPFKPNLQQILLMGLLLAMAGGVGLVTVMEYFDTSFYKIEDLESFSELPVIASISKIKEKKKFFTMIIEKILSVIATISKMIKKVGGISS